ncbi:peptidyl-prolyl cis-trans isomerase [Bacillus sp. 03113]|uniref:peptidyl-prolyl cis-trans isomerase n=1 Tax=Bacillus sp. 03113 TaxID=2578211 RepID=UPI00215C5F54|nr:peptidyl-prolyl cis-trans isomerase [Bacillus sp. 03113]
MRVEMLKKNHLLMIIAGLVLLNVLTIILFLTWPSLNEGNNETVATVGKKTVTRQDWLEEMEGKYGKETLKQLVNEKVIDEMADKYKVKISDQEITRELLMVKTMYGSDGVDAFSGEVNWKRQIKYNLMLEELLTRDVHFDEREMKKYYDENIRLYHIPDSYHVSQIVSKTKEEADQTLKELKNGSNFSVLAMERSIDKFSAEQGGDVGYINTEDGRFSPSFIEQVKKLKPGTWSEPIQKDTDFVIVLLHDKIKGKNYSYKEVKKQIRRQMALEQMDAPASAESLWKESDVEWFYGKDK